MDQQKLTELLHLQETAIVERTPFCPDEHEIAAYVDGNGDYLNNEHAERHLVSCSYCLARVAILVRLHESDDEVQIPEPLFTSADQFGQNPRRRLYHVPAWAAAAVVIITLFTFVGMQPDISVDTGVQIPPVKPLGEVSQQLRNINRTSLAPTVLAPNEGGSIRPDDMTVRWSSVPGSLYYDIRIVNADGFMIWQDRVEDTQRKLPDHLELISGGQYFVRVDAYLAEAKSISSRHVKFNIAEEN